MIDTKPGDQVIRKSGFGYQEIRRPGKDFPNFQISQSPNPDIPISQYPVYRYPAIARRGQSVLEYAILLFVLCTVFVVMFAYMRGAVKAKFFVVQERMNDAVR